MMEYIKALWECWKTRARLIKERDAAIAQRDKADARARLAQETADSAEESWIEAYMAMHYMVYSASVKTSPYWRLCPDKRQKFVDAYWKFYRHAQQASMPYVPDPLALFAERVK